MNVLESYHNALLSASVKNLQTKVSVLQKEVKELKEQNITIKSLLLKRQNNQSIITKDISFVKHKISELITHITLLKNKLKK